LPHPYPARHPRLCKSTGSDQAFKHMQAAHIQLSAATGQRSSTEQHRSEQHTSSTRHTLDTPITPSSSSVPCNCWQGRAWSYYVGLLRHGHHGSAYGELLLLMRVLLLQLCCNRLVIPCLVQSLGPKQMHQAVCGSSKGNVFRKGTCIRCLQASWQYIC
jgi:hypothetical protein